MKNNFSQNLRNALEQRGVFGQEDAAKLLNISQAMVSKYFKSGSIPPRKKLAQFAKVLKVPIESLTGEIVNHSTLNAVSVKGNDSLIIDVPSQFKISGVEIFGNKVKINIA